MRRRESRAKVCRSTCRSRRALDADIYGSRQLGQAADAAAEVVADPGVVPGLEMTSEAPVLRDFAARFRPL
jgi:tryptophanase